MSWNGPVAGTTPYQPSPYPSGQPTFGQPQTFQHGQQPNYNQYQHGATFPQPGVPPPPMDSRPPKKKGNPIITRYPPPPGYRGPAQPQAPYGSAQYSMQYQQPQQPYPQGPQGHPYLTNSGYPAPSAAFGYPPQSYGPPQSHSQQPAFPHPSYPQAPNYQWPQQPQPNHTQQPGSQASGHPAAQGYPAPQSTYQSYPAQAAPRPANQQAWSHASGWQQLSTPTAYPPASQHGSFGGPPLNVHTGPNPNATPAPPSTLPAAPQSNTTTSQPQSATSEHASGEKPPLYLAWDDWDFDFDGAIWPKANEPVDPNLSLGVIIWRPAKQVTRALPSTFSNAEEQALRPPAEKLGNGESVSIYFTTENSHEAFLDVRQTDEWYKIHRDPIFVTFSDEEMKQNLVPIEECINLRDRPDEPLEEIEDEDEVMHGAAWNVMDNLEQALSANTENSEGVPRRNAVPSRQQTQEDILAKLGVTGAPKPPSNEPIAVQFIPDEKSLCALPNKPSAPPPAHIPPHPQPPAQRAQSFGDPRNPAYTQPIARPYSSLSSVPSTQPPPPPQQRYDPWNLKPSNNRDQTNLRALDRSRASPVHSEGSNRTLAGSDFESEQPSNKVDEASTPPISQLKRSGSSFARKRSYEHTDQEEEELRQQDDHTKRKRRSQVAAAYR